jgi:hypothetical protein
MGASTVKKFYSPEPPSYRYNQLPIIYLLHKVSHQWSTTLADVWSNDGVEKSEVVTRRCSTNGQSLGSRINFLLIGGVVVLPADSAIENMGAVSL